MEMNPVEALRYVMNNLEHIEVKGRRNMDLMLSSIQVLEQITRVASVNPEEKPEQTEPAAEPVIDLE